MTLVRGVPAGPNGLGGAYENPVEGDRAAFWAATGGRQRVLRGLAASGVAGQMSLSLSPGQAVVDERDAAGAAGTTLRGYLVWSDVATIVQFGPASPSARNDAVVAAFVDVEDGPVGTGALTVGAHLVVVPGVSGTATARTDAQITAWLGRGGWLRLFDVPVAATDTQINVANVVANAAAYAWGRASRTANLAVVGAVETVVLAAPFLAVAGDVYRAVACLSVSCTVATNYSTLALYDDTAATGTTGTQIQFGIKDHRAVGRQEFVTMTTWFTAAASGPRFVKLTLSSNSSSTSTAVASATQPAVLTVERMG